MLLGSKERKKRSIGPDRSAWRPLRHSADARFVRYLQPEMMCLFTSDDFRGEIITCDEGELEWVSKTEVPKLPTWEGDAIFLKLLLDNEERFFTLKLVYKNEKLVEKAVQIY